MPRPGLQSVVESQRLNALLAWLIVVLIGAAGTTELASGTIVRGAFALAAFGLAVVPPAAFRSLEAMLPWEVLGLAALPVLSQSLLVGETVGGVTFTGRLTTYFGVAGIALVIAVELDLFTPVRMNEPFAVLFVTITTMAAAGIWAVARWLSDQLLGTRLLLNGRPEEAIETALMWDFVAATTAGVGAGILFVVYFRRRANVQVRLPEDVEVML